MQSLFRCKTTTNQSSVFFAIFTSLISLYGNYLKYATYSEIFGLDSLAVLVQESVGNGL